jgi:hypothetical protein
MGRFLSRGCPEGPIHFLVPQFLCSTWESPFLRPAPRLMAPAARRSGQGWRVSATEGSSLRVPSTTAHLARVGDDEIEGSPRVVHDCSCHILVCGGYRDPDHDAVMRIGSQAPRRRTHSDARHASHGIGRGPATSNCHRRPVANCADRQRNLQTFLSDLPFNVRDGGRRPQARRHLSRGATRR